MDAQKRLSRRQKDLKTFYDGTRKANLDVEIAVDMLSLAGRYDTAVLVSGDEDFVYAINAVAYKGCRVEVAGFRSNTAPRLIDVSDFFIDLGEIGDLIRKDISGGEYVPSFVPPDDIHITDGTRSSQRQKNRFAASGVNESFEESEKRPIANAVRAGEEG
jgi:hypothetical protein